MMQHVMHIFKKAETCPKIRTHTLVSHEILKFVSEKERLKQNNFNSTKCTSTFKGVPIKR